MLTENAIIDPRYKSTDFVSSKNVTYVSVNDELFICFGRTFSTSYFHFTPEIWLSVIEQGILERTPQAVIYPARSEKLAEKIYWMDLQTDAARNPFKPKKAKTNPTVPAYAVEAAFEKDGNLYTTELFCPMEYLGKYEKVIQAILPTIKAVDFTQEN